MARWQFATAGQILFGRGAATDAAAIVSGFGSRVFVITGATPRRAAWLIDELPGRGCACATLRVAGEPNLTLVREGADTVRRERIDVVVGVGGGSALDAAKAIAALATNGGDPLDYLEVVGRGQPLRAAPLPCVAIPTTAGTGSEVTRNAVLTVPDRRVKVSLRDARMLPRAAIVDPDLTLDLPPNLTAQTGLDALTQLIEPFLSVRATPLVDALCRDGISRAARSLHAACLNGGDAAAREDMALASLFGGLALANAGLGAVHGLAGPIGGMFSAPHGAVCAALLPHVLAANLDALHARAPASQTLPRMDELARLLTGRTSASPDEGVAWLADLVRDLAIPPLSAWGIAPADLTEIVRQAQRSSSMQGNPVALTADELTMVLSTASQVPGRAFC
jgi:alcohol dehydrogenase class IV